jgi:hypothetical protein
VGRPRRAGQMHTVNRAGDHRLSGPPRGQSRPPRPSSPRRPARPGVGSLHVSQLRRGRVVAAAGPTNDGTARPGDLDPTTPRLLDAQPPRGRVALRADDPTVRRLAAAAPRPRRATGHA